ncbi:hypothetical protein M3Y96_00251900 [Aphelenchoides besseyi]|nr:hypothetical protein M3Y96_00251900 [Aphelenchoides besseyi]
MSAAADEDHHSETQSDKRESEEAQSSPPPITNGRMDKSPHSASPPLNDSKTEVKNATASEVVTNGRLDRSPPQDATPPPSDALEPEADERLSSNVETKPQKSTLEGWETPPQEPVKGMVQPRYIPPHGKPTRNTNCLDYISKNVLKPAMKHQKSWPFKTPVDTLALKCEDYHKIIKKPMDLGTIDKRLKNFYYYSASECVKDIGTVFTNCYAYNPPNYDVHKMAKELEEFLLNKLNKIPPDEYEIPRFPSKRSSKYDKKSSKSLGRSSSIASAAGRVSRESSIQRSEAASDRQSVDKKPIKRKLESPMPPVVEEKRRNVEPRPKRPDIDYALLPPRYHGKLSKQMIFCQKLLKDMTKTKLSQLFTWPFLEPVDEVKLGITGYYDIIKEPMDIQTMQKKLNALQYANPQEFYDDFQLICKNCFLYNPPDQPVHKCGKSMQDWFNKRWAEMPKDEPVQRQPKLPSAIKHDPYAFSTAPPPALAMPPPSVATSAQPHQNYGPINDDSDLDTLLFDVQTEQTRVTNLVSELQQFVTELLALKYRRREADSHNMAKPELSSQLHTVIRNRLSTSHLSSISTQNFATTTSLSSGPSLYNSHSGSMIPNLGANAASALYSAAAVAPGTSQKSRAKVGRPKGSVSGARQASMDLNQQSIPNGPLISPAAASQAISTPTMNAYGQLAAVSSANPPPVKSGRGRPSGSKNKPKLPPTTNQERRQYEFNSDDDNADEPMTYDEKKRLSHNINNLQSDKLTEVLSIISSREKALNDEDKPDEVEIDFETLKPQTLRELEAFVNACYTQTKPRAQKPSTSRTEVDAETRKRQLEERLAALNGNQTTTRTENAPSNATTEVRRAPARNDASSESSSSSSSSSSSEGSSSDSSDSESEQTNQWSSVPKKSSPMPGAANGAANDRRRVGSKPTTNNNTIPVKSKTEDASRPAASSTLLSSRNTSTGASSGIGVSVLDQLLPETMAAVDAGLPKPNVNQTFDMFRRKKMEKEIATKNIREQEENRRKMEMEKLNHSDGSQLMGGVQQPPVAEIVQEPPSMSNEDFARLRELERIRRMRESESTFSNQMDIMANFEDQF